MNDDARLDLVTVYAGPVWRVLLLEGEFAAEGIPCLVPDRMIKTIDPFITGANALDLRLQVPAEHAEAARALIAAHAAEKSAAPPPAPEDARALEVARLGRRIRWASLFGFTAPIAFYYAPRYFREAAALTDLPAEHRWTIAALPLAAGTALLAVSYLFWA